jgi:hypothetical protein
VGKNLKQKASQQVKRRVRKKGRELWRKGRAELPTAMGAGSDELRGPILA